MKNSVQIPAGETAFIQAVHCLPEEDYLDAKKRLLIVMIHGFPGSKHAHENVYADLESLLGDKDYHTLRFDFRGCGESDGREEDFTLHSAAEDLENVMAWARDQGYERFIFVGEGLGAAISILNAPWDAECFVFLWPMLDLPRIAKFAFHAGEIEDTWKEDGFATIDNHRIGLNFIEELEKTELPQALKDFEKPVMIMHGAKDTASPIQQLEMVRTHVKARRVEITTFHDGTHGLPQLNHRKTMFYHILQFVEKYT